MELGTYKTIYQLNKEVMGFKKGKEYLISINKEKNACYEIHELNEDLYMMCASEISIKRYFKILEKID
jgi:hypothetical protein